MAALLDPPPVESFSRTDSTPMTLVGGRYIVTAAGTFGDSGAITLEDSDGNVFASFTDDGVTVVDLRFGVFNFAVSSVTDLSATIKTGTY